MAVRRALSKALTTPPPPSTASKAHYHQEAESSLFRRFLQRRAINNHSSPSNAFPSFLSLPVGKKLREKLNSMNHHLPHEPTPPPPPEEGFRVGAADARRLMRLVQMGRIKERLRNIPASTIPYGEFLRLCYDACENSETAVEFAKALDQSGNVIVLGGVVFLRPDQVAKSMERLISESIALPNDPRKKELENLEKEKAWIDKKAQSMVRGELYCGLGFLVAQTLGFMRLTFWELTWDVMEPICFFATSFHFGLAYAFFLRTSKEPTFEGYFQRRFKVKQNKLVKIHNFDVKRYDHLCEVFYAR